jgi:fructokinase
LAQLLQTLVLATAPQRILLGGGVMHAQRHLFERLRRQLQSSLNHYIEAPQIGECIEQYIGPPELGEMAGPLGALALAQDAL